MPLLLRILNPHCIQRWHFPQVVLCVQAAVCWGHSSYIFFFIRGSCICLSMFCSDFTWLPEEGWPIPSSRSLSSLVQILPELNIIYAQSMAFTEYSRYSLLPSVQLAGAWLFNYWSQRLASSQQSIEPLYGLVSSSIKWKEWLLSFRVAGNIKLDIVANTVTPYVISIANLLITALDWEVLWDY